MSEKLCALRKIGGGISELMLRLEGNSGNSSGGNVGAGVFKMPQTHPFSKIRLTARGGSVGVTRLAIDTVTTATPSLNQDYDIKGKSVSLQIYVSGSSAYSSAYFDFILS